MCGIAGIRRFGPEPITEDQITTLLCALEHRGSDATGVALMRGDEIIVCKKDVPAATFCGDPAFRKLMDEELKEDTDICILHTRSWTQGPPHKMENNHPLFVGKSAVVHNGMIHNDDRLFKEKKLDRHAEVDSDILRAIVDEEGITKKCIRELNAVNGSAAIAAISNEYPGWLLLARSGSPLVLAATEHQLVWASEKMAIHSAMRPYTKRFGLWWQPNNRPDIGFMTLQDNSAWLFGPTGLEWHDKFNATYSYNPPTYDIHGNFRKHRERDLAARKENPDVVVCLNPACKEPISLPKKYKKTPLTKLYCTKCGWYLGCEPGVETPRIGTEISNSIRGSCDRNQASGRADRQEVGAVVTGARSPDWAACSGSGVLWNRV